MNPQTTSRRAALAALLLLGSLGAQAQSDKPVRMLVPLAAGSTVDAVARAIAPAFGKATGHPVVVENIVGAGGIPGTTQIVKAPKDGLTLGMVSSNHVINPGIYKSIPYDSLKDITPIAVLATVPLVLVVNPALPVKTVAELLAYAKANPGKLNFGSTGIGSSMHLAGELFMVETGTKMVHVPYNAPATATTNMMANDIQLMFQLIPGIAGQVKAGKVRAIAIMSPERSPALPDVPTMKEVGLPTLMSSTWFALLAPRGTPAPIIERMNAEINAILRDKDFRQRLADVGATPIGGTSDDLRKHLASEIDKWGAVVKAAGITIQ